MIPPDSRVCAQCADPDRPVRARGVCHRCYQRFRKAARTSGIVLKPVSRSLRDRLLARAFPIANGCWEWRGTLTTRKYGRIKHPGGRAALAHRVSYELVYGPIPDGLVLDHRCHTEDTTCPGGDDCMHRRCVNPHHLDVVTQGENTRRSPHSISTAYARRDSCVNGHPFSEANTYRRAGGSRQCRTCGRIGSRTRYATKKEVQA